MELEASVALDNQGGGPNIAGYPGPMLRDIKVESAESIVVIGGVGKLAFRGNVSGVSFASLGM